MDVMVGYVITHRCPNDMRTYLRELYSSHEYEYIVHANIHSEYSVNGWCYYIMTVPCNACIIADSLTH